MALLVPFRGIHYDPTKIRDLRDVVAPPYDVISPEAQDAFYRRHPWNVIRLILNKETSGDNARHNRYTRAAAHYRAWLKAGILLRAGTPHFYFLEEEFGASTCDALDRDSASSKKVRRGFIGLLRLEEFSRGVVLPHEKTQSKPKADRLALMEACRANFSQIFSLYSDEERAMAPLFERVFAAGAPACELTDDEGTRHTLRVVNDPQILKEVTEFMRPKKIFIADGHHRYETALAYRERQRTFFPQNTGREAYHFTMMYLTAMEEEGLLVLPTHRVVGGLEGFQASAFLEQLQTDFSVESFVFESRREGISRGRFLNELACRSDKGQTLGMLLQGTEQFYLLSLKDERALDKAAPVLSSTLKALDVNLLHILIFQKLLKIDSQDLAAGKKVLYFKESREAIEAVRSGRGQMAFFLNPTKVYQVRDVSLAGETMPSKSTFFYPKLLSGLVINSLDPDEEIAME
jgi:uncharacterized protein (DUF1015 family)